jgi:hypothetical protein
MQSIMLDEIPMENQLIRIKDKDFSLSSLHNECKDWGLELVCYFPLNGKIIDATFKILDMHKYMLFLIKNPVKIYPI